MFKNVRLVNLFDMVMLHLITTHLVSHLSLSSIVFISSMLIIAFTVFITLTSSHYDTPCNRFYNNYVIIICSRQLL